MSDQPVDPLIGTEIDGFLIEGVLGRGGMGIVYQAQDLALSRTVALKMIDPGLARDETFVQRFKSEARALARVNSPYIVGVHTYRQTEYGLFIVMEYVEGGTVGDILVQQGGVPVEEALPMIKQMLMAFEAAHSVGVIHRDIKPANIMLTRDRMVKVTDFGMAKLAQNDLMQTVTKGAVGTLYYMSPEQVQGIRDIDHRSDLYSLGMTVYEMMVGGVPFDKDSGEFAIMRQIVEDEVPSLGLYLPHLPEGFVDIVMKALKKDPNERWSSAAEMLAAIAEYEGIPLSAVTSGAPYASASPYASGAPYEMPSQAPYDSGAVTAPTKGGGRIRKEFIILGVIIMALIGLWYTQGGNSSDDPSSTELVQGANDDTTATSNGTDPVASNDPPDDPVNTPPAQPPAQDNTTTPGSTQVLMATVNFSSTPSGADVIVGGQVVGRTPLNGYVADAGALQVTMRLAGYQQWQQNYTLQGGQTRDVAAQLQQGLVSVTLNVEPGVTVNGETPGANGAMQLPGGSQTVTFVHPTYGSSTETINVTAGLALSYFFTHKVNVQTRIQDSLDLPPSGDIIKNNQDTGENTPKQLEEGPGTIRYSVLVDSWEVAPSDTTLTIAPMFADEQPTHRLVFYVKK